MRLQPLAAGTADTEAAAADCIVESAACNGKAPVLAVAAADTESARWPTQLLDCSCIARISDLASWAHIQQGNRLTRYTKLSWQVLLLASSRADSRYRPPVPLVSRTRPMIDMCCSTSSGGTSSTGYAELTLRSSKVPSTRLLRYFTRSSSP